MISPYQKIHIIGGAGSGKTTLALWLGEELSLPCFHLDDIGWDAFGKVPLQKRRASILQIIAQPHWITEGVFLWWTDPLLENADVILWLDLSFPRTMWRMVKRHAQASLHGSNPHPGIKKLVKFILDVGKQHYRRNPITPAGPDDDFAITRVATRQILERYPQKLVHCRNPKDVARFQSEVAA